MKRAGAGRGMLLAAGAAALACSDGELAPMRVERAVLDLIAAQHLRSVEEESADAPVRARLFRVGDGIEDLFPGLAMTPSARVTIAIPPQPEGAVLELVPCMDRRSAEIPGDLAWSARLDGQVVLEHRARCRDVVHEERRVARVPIGAEGGVLVLETAWSGAGAPAPAAGFGELVIRAPHEHARYFATPEYPNVVLILVDTLRADRLGAYGHPRAVSPTIDALAARGTLFESAWADSSWTIPSTVSVLTGVAAARHGVEGVRAHYLGEGHVTIAERFLDYGIDTAAFSCNPLVSAGVNFDQGFQHYVTTEWTDTAEIMDEVLAWLDARDGGRFFLYLHLVDPHDPYTPDQTIALRLAGTPPTAWTGEPQTELAERLTRGTADPRAVEAAVAHNAVLYDAEIASLDAQLARFVAALDAHGHLDRTVIALTSDHGEEFLEHGLVGHSLQVHEESVRVPLIVAGPGVPAGRRVARPVQNRDLGAALLELARVALGDFRGASSLFDETASESAVFFGTARGLVYEPAESRWIRAGDLVGVRKGGWQLHWSAASGERAEIVRLWNLEADPAAQHDVAARHPEVVDALRAELARWLAASERTAPELSEGEAERERLRAAGYAGAEDD